MWIDKETKKKLEVLNQVQAAQFLGVSVKTLQKYCCEGKIPHQKLERRYLFSREALIKWLENSC